MAKRPRKELAECEESILTTLIQQYIHSASPVSSQQITERLSSHLSPASVRARFQALTEKGYLKQPHTSAGRIPTEKAYRFFVDMLSREYEQKLAALADLQLEMEEALRLQKEFSRTLHLVTGMIEGESDMRSLGFAQLFREPEFEDHDMVVRFGKFLDRIPLRQTYYVRKLGPRGFNIFIGNENHDPEAKDLTVVLSAMEGGNMFFAAGPARMDYDRIMHIFMRL